MAKAAPIAASPAATTGEKTSRGNERLPIPIAVTVIVGLSLLLWMPILYGLSLLFG